MDVWWETAGRVSRRSGRQVGRTLRALVPWAGEAEEPDSVQQIMQVIVRSALALCHALTPTLMMQKNSVKSMPPESSIIALSHIFSFTLTCPLSPPLPPGVLGFWAIMQDDEQAREAAQHNGNLDKFKSSVAQGGRSGFASMAFRSVVPRGDGGVRVACKRCDAKGGCGVRGAEREAAPGEWLYG